MNKHLPTLANIDVPGRNAKQRAVLSGVYVGEGSPLKAAGRRRIKRVGRSSGKRMDCWRGNEGGDME